MTNRTKFIIGILVLLGIVFAIEFRTSPKFVWIPTFSHTEAFVYASGLLRHEEDGVAVAARQHIQGAEVYTGGYGGPDG